MSRDEITIRSYEQRQLLNILPDVVDFYEEKELDSRIDTLNSVISEIESMNEETIDLGYDTWSTVSTALDEMDSTKASWLSAKIARRAELPAYDMGFTTFIPVGPMISDKKPERSRE